MSNIRSMIFRARLNPFGLKWQRFTVAVDDAGQIIGCVQRKPHYDGSQELTSLVVVPEHRRQGVGSRLIQHVKETTNPPLWLICLARLVPYYEQFGFVEKRDMAELTPYYRRLRRLVNVVRRFLRRDKFLAIMVWQ